MKRKDMKRKDKTAQMIGQVIQPVAYHASEYVDEPQNSLRSHQQPLLQTTLSRELGLNLGDAPARQSTDVADLAKELWASLRSSTQTPEPQQTKLATKPSTITTISGQPSDSRAIPSRYRITQLLSQKVGKRTFLAVEEHSQSPVVITLLLFSPDMEAEAEEETESVHQQQDYLPSYEPAANLPYLESFEVNTPLGEGLALVKPCTDASLLAINAAQSTQAHSHQSGGQANEPPSHIQSRSSSITTTNAPTHTPRYTYSRFKVKATRQKLEVQIPESYIQEGIIVRETHTPSPTVQIEMWLLTVLGTVVFVGGVVASTGSIPAGIVVAVLLPVLHRALIGPPPVSRRIAKLRVTSEVDGRAFVSLTSMAPPIRDRTGRINGGPVESRLHGSRLSIKSVKVSPTLTLSSGFSPFKAQLCFTFHNQDWHSKQLRIVGTYQEIRWLSHHLSQWGRARCTRRIQ